MSPHRPRVSESVLAVFIRVTTGRAYPSHYRPRVSESVQALRIRVSTGRAYPSQYRPRVCESVQAARIRVCTGRAYLSQYRYRPYPSQYRPCVSESVQAVRIRVSTGCAYPRQYRPCVRIRVSTGRAYLPGSSAAPANGLSPTDSGPWPPASWTRPCRLGDGAARPGSAVGFFGAAGRQACGRIFARPGGGGGAGCIVRVAMVFHALSSGPLVGHFSELSESVPAVGPAPCENGVPPSARQARRSCGMPLVRRIPPGPVGPIAAAAGGSGLITPRPGGDPKRRPAGHLLARGRRWRRKVSAAGQSPPCALKLALKLQCCVVASAVASRAEPCGSRSESMSRHRRTSRSWPGSPC